MIAVLDSNCFKGDMRAARPGLRSVLEAVAKGAFRLVVPEVVLDELDKQFARRSKRAYREIGSVIRTQQGEFEELGLPLPEVPGRDEDEVAGFRTALEASLTASGATIAPYPEDLRPAVQWAVERRRPFDDGGKGFPDAVIWLTVLQIAKEHGDETISLVTSDNDFAESKNDPQLAGILRDDLEALDLLRDQVRRVPGISPFVEELGQRLQASRERAEALIEANVFDSAIESHFFQAELDQGPLRLGVDLDNDPTVTSWDLESLHLRDAVTLPGSGIYLEVTAHAHALLNLVIYRADYYLAAEEDYVPFALSNPDLTRHYVEAEAELDLELSLSIIANEDGSDAQVDLLEVGLAPLELARRDLVDNRSEFLDQLRPVLIGREIDEFSPAEPIESEIEEVTVEAICNEESLRIEEVFSGQGEEVAVQIVLSCEADVSWSVTAPTSFDAEQFAALALNEESGAPILQDVESRTPLEIELTAEWDVSTGWHELEVTRIALASDEMKVRSSRPSAAEEVEMEHLLGAVEEDLDQEPRD